MKNITMIDLKLEMKGLSQLTKLINLDSNNLNKKKCFKSCQTLQMIEIKNKRKKFNFIDH